MKIEKKSKWSRWETICSWCFWIRSKIIFVLFNDFVCNILLFVFFFDSLWWDLWIILVNRIYSPFMLMLEDHWDCLHCVSLPCMMYFKEKKKHLNFSVSYLVFFSSSIKDQRIRWIDGELLTRRLFATVGSALGNRLCVRRASVSCSFLNLSSVVFRLIAIDFNVILNVTCERSHQHSRWCRRSLE